LKELFIKNEYNKHLFKLDTPNLLNLNKLHIQSDYISDNTIFNIAENLKKLQDISIQTINSVETGMYKIAKNLFTLIIS
jgi:hypothetical protein